MIIAGIDEAGYGPLLGPLVVSATALELGAGPWDGATTMEAEALPCLWRLLKAAVAKKTPVRKGRLLIADSKIVHNLNEGNKLLEPRRAGVPASHAGWLPDWAKPRAMAANLTYGGC